MDDTRDLYRGYQWKMRPWRKNVTPDWNNGGYTRQRENEEYEPRQLDYDTGLPMEKAVRNKKFVLMYEMGAAHIGRSAFLSIFIFKRRMTHLIVLKILVEFVDTVEILLHLPNNLL